MSVTIAAAWENGRFQLHATSPTPQLDARLLLEHVLQVNHSYLLAHGHNPMPPAAWQQFQQLVARAKRQEPIPYLLGTAPFFDFDLHVTTAVLIPRPETEELVEKAVSLSRRFAQPHLVDVGTGSGCIAIALAHFLPQATITAVDISLAALAIAQQNAATYAPQRITFCQGSLLQPVAQPADLIIANLPYVTTAEWTALDDGVKLFEPRLALDGGADGLDLVRDLLAQAIVKLTPQGALLLEIGWQQGAAARAAAQAVFPNAAIQVERDLAGRERFLLVDLAAVA